jgi:hypothetical protein
MYFKVIVVVIALVILILYLTIIGTQISYANSRSIYPPIKNQCPDNWRMDASGNCMIPSPGSGLCGNITNCNFGSTKPQTYGILGGGDRINFADTAWVQNGSSAQCSQRSWANSLGIHWDTVTNYNQCN